MSALLLELVGQGVDWDGLGPAPAPIGGYPEN